MTLFELLSILLCLGAGVAGSAQAGARLGAIGYIGGFLAGAGAVPLLAKGWLYVDSRFFFGPETYPACSCGGSQLVPEQNDIHTLVMRCPCGAAFVRRRGRVLVVEQNASLRPYMRWHWRRGWLPSAQVDLLVDRS